MWCVDGWWVGVSVVSEALNARRRGPGAYQLSTPAPAPYKFKFSQASRFAYAAATGSGGVPLHLHAGLSGREHDVLWLSDALTQRTTGHLGGAGDESAASVVLSGGSAQGEWEQKREDARARLTGTGLDSAADMQRRAMRIQSHSERLTVCRTMRCDGGAFITALAHFTLWVWCGCAANSVRRAAFAVAALLACAKGHG
jgi:hypothetical protein